MKMQVNSDGSKYLKITKNLLIFRPYTKGRVHFIFAKAKGFKKLYGLINCRFNINKGANYKPLNVKNLRALIRLPFFYWEKNNFDWCFGLPNLYLCRV